MTFPITIGTDFIRRVGLSDIYLLTPGAIITVSVNKRGGLYTGQIVYTTDLLPTKHSTWESASADDTADVVDTAIPSNATGVAFICTAITDTALPRVGAAVSVKDANSTSNLTVHNRVRTYSGDVVVPSASVFDPTPAFLQNADIVFRADILSSLWLDTARTMPALGLLDEQIHFWDNIGTLTSFAGLAENVAGDHAFYTVSGLNGLPEIRSDGTNTSMKGVPGTAFVTAGSGMSVFAIFNNFTNAFNEAMQFGDSASDDFAIVDGGSGGEMNRNAAGNLLSFSGPLPTYFYANMQADGTIAAGGWDFSASSEASGAEGAQVLDLSTAAQLFLFSPLTTGSTPVRCSELYILNNFVSQADIDAFKAHALSKYGLTKA